MTTERRRNMRAENCRACGQFCEAGQGYLYRDNTGRTVRRLGRFGWFVKCEKCHDGGKSRLTVTMEKQAAARATEPVVRAWTVSQVKKWTVILGEHDGDVAIIVSCDAFSEVISYRDHISSRFTAPTGYGLEQKEFAGKPLSDKAAQHLGPQILALVQQVQAEEQQSGEAALAKLVSAGAVASPNPTGYGWKVDFKGGQFYLWGFCGDKNKVTGVTQTNENGKWIETTAEELVNLL